MRLFVAVDPPPEQRAAVDAALVEGALVDAAPGERGDELRWVPPEQWHLTLVFCGEVEERLLPELTERLSRAAARTQPFSLRLSRAGTFPKNAARSRVLWLGVDGDVPVLTRLAERCAAAARRSGIDVEGRPYRPHLTLARARRQTADARSVVARLESFATNDWKVTSFRLVHSTVGNTVTHKTLQTFSLASGGDEPPYQA